jgi:integrase
MIGGIYTNQCCPICGCKFKDDGKKGLICSDHPEYGANKFFVRFKGGIFKRFNDYESAQRFLTGLRYKYDEGSFDIRDYRKDNPLGFENLASEWLEVKRNQVKSTSFRNFENYIGRAVDAWGQTNIKLIGYAEIEDFLLQQKIRGTHRPVSSKTRVDLRNTLHSFWKWLRKRRVLSPAQMPEFPEMSFELGYRKVVNKETQNAIIAEVRNISYHVNPKIWIGIKWLATYISIRPAELLNIREGDFDLGLGVVFIPHPKEKRPKTVPLLDEDIEIVRSFPQGLPDLFFFRHVSERSGAKPGQKFGKKSFYKWWKRACHNLGVEGVDLYGGTRHSSARALRKFRSPEEIKKATMHSTNKAFERYFQIELEDIKTIYAETKEAAPNLHHNLVQPEKGKLLKIKK